LPLFVSFAFFVVVLFFSAALEMRCIRGSTTRTAETQAQVDERSIQPRKQRKTRKESCFVVAAKGRAGLFVVILSRLEKLQEANRATYHEEHQEHEARGMTAFLIAC
jgi:hypothetical protein